MMLEQISEHLPWLAKLNANAREGIYQFVMFGMTTPQLLNTQAVATAIAVGVLSAFGSAYISTERMAIKLEQYAKAQEEFRVEMRLYARDSTTEIRSLADRMTRQEITSGAYHANGVQGMSANGKAPR